MFVELSKLRKLLKKSVDEMTDLEKWAVFLRYADSPDHRGVVNRILESREGLNVAGELLMNISQDERERAIFRSRRKYQTDLESNMLTAKREGRAEGRAEDEKAKTITIAKNALQMNMPVVEIAKLTMA